MGHRLTTQVAVVGAGYAGLACAVELAAAGIHVEVFEASRTLGGRARAVELDGMTVDNGAHILVGAYRETLRLMQIVGTPENALQRRSLHLEFPGQFRIAAPGLPAPLHLAWALLTATGLRWREKTAALRFLRALKKIRFRLPRDMPVARMIAHQPPMLRRFLWEPLCLAALNTPARDASAQVFLNVLRDTLAAGRAASDLLLPATDFSSLFPEPAARFIVARGGVVHRSRRIRALEELAAFDHRVVAVAPWHLPALLPQVDLANRNTTGRTECFLPLEGQNERSEVLRGGLTWQPIATIYLHYPEAVRLPYPMLGLANGHGQWVFDRGQLTGQAGLLAVVISGAGPWQALDHAQLGRAIHRQLTPLLPMLVLPRKTWVIEEKRATFACTPGLARPPAATDLPGVWLAGDYVAGEYPATLEGAVRSGVATAQKILSEILSSPVGEEVAAR